MFSVEFLPIVLGGIIALLGATLVYDARRDDGLYVLRERRRRQRTPRNRPGEALIGLGMVLGGIALLGRDNWRYGTVAVIAGFVLVATGTVLNRDYLKEVLLFRGAARRAGPDERLPQSEEPTRRPRIR